MRLFIKMVLPFFIILPLISMINSKPSSLRKNNPFQQQFSTRKIHSHDLILGTPESTDMLLLNVTVTKEKVPGRVIYEDLNFDEQTYSGSDSLSSKVCPFNITGISLIHQDADGISGYPVILSGGVGTVEATILFVSKKGEGINYWARIWGRPYTVENQNYNLLQGVPSQTDDLLMYTNVCENGEFGESVTASVVYDTPDNKIANITSVQAWDISKGCELGSYPVVIEGGVGFDHVKIEITSPVSWGFQYHVLVFGELKKRRLNGNQIRGIGQNL
ncbi:uncharacterized protein LOC142322456 isoform X2 [Lycorma delicatula]